MKISVKKMTKAAGAVCAATGIVALSALAASVLKKANEKIVEGVVDGYKK